MRLMSELKRKSVRPGLGREGWRIGSCMIRGGGMRGRRGGSKRGREGGLVMDVGDGEGGIFLEISGINELGRF